jgi:hypothetical protein
MRRTIPLAPQGLNLFGGSGVPTEPSADPRDLHIQMNAAPPMPEGLAINDVPQPELLVCACASRQRG